MFIDLVKVRFLNIISKKPEDDWKTKMIGEQKLPRDEINRIGSLLRDQINESRKTTKGSDKWEAEDY